MNTFTSDDLKADAFPQAGAGPPGVQRVDREPVLVPPDGLQMRVWQRLRLSVPRSARDCRRDVDGLRAQVTRLEAGPASRGQAAG
jgi:hypothetical protein